MFWVAAHTPCSRPISEAAPHFGSPPIFGRAPLFDFAPHLIFVPAFPPRPQPLNLCPMASAAPISAPFWVAPHVFCRTAPHLPQEMGRAPDFGSRPKQNGSWDCLCRRDGRGQGERGVGHGAEGPGPGPSPGTGAEMDGIVWMGGVPGAHLRRMVSFVVERGGEGRGNAAGGSMPPPALPPMPPRPRPIDGKYISKYASNQIHPTEYTGWK